MNRKQDELDKCIQYFRSKQGFERLFRGIQEKYISLSRFGGTVKLTSLTDVEKEALEGFFQRPFPKKKTVTISVEQFQKALEATRFAEVSLESIIEGYFGESLESKREEKQRKEKQWNDFLDNIEEEFADTFSVRWFQGLRETGGAQLVYIKQLYQEEPNTLKEILIFAMEGADAFPVWKGERKRLAVFATEVTGNPHYFDVGTQAHRILFYLMEAYLEQHPFDTQIWELDEKRYEVEKRMEWMFHVGLLSDEIFNRTVAYGIHLRRDTGKLHKGIEGFAKEKQPVTVMLYQMRDVTEAYGEGNEVYIFENPSVFTEFVQRYSEEHITAVCTSGQLTFTSLLLLDLLVKGGSSLYYSGDFDPEGLQIADRLKIRYQDKLILWHYGLEDYEKSKSSKQIAKASIAKLDKIQSSELSKVAQIMKSEGVAGYQEALLGDYVI